MNNLIYKKMSEVMKDIGHVGKDQKNLSQGFKFRGIDQFVNALYPALTKHGVFMAPRATSFSQELKEVTRSNGKSGIDKHVAIQVEYDFFAEDGSKVTIGPIPAEGLDSGDKATNKALSAALKYALIQTFSIPTEDMAEADLDSPEIGKPTASKVVVATSENNINAEFDAIAKPVTAPTPVKTSSFRKNAKTTVTPSTELTVEEWA
jgi:hypothetical protein